MSDLEQRLTDALTEGAQDAPAATGLAAAARSRARHRRRARVAGAAAAVALAVGVPTAIVATGLGLRRPVPGRERPERRQPRRAGRLPLRELARRDHRGARHLGLRHAQRVVRGRRAGRRGSSGPVTWRADRLRPEAFGYGVSFQEIDNRDDFQWPVVQQPGDSWPQGAYVGGRGIGGVLVMVACRTRPWPRSPGLGAVQRRRDPNGCPVDSSSDPVVPGDAMTVCRYDDAGRSSRASCSVAPISRPRSWPSGRRRPRPPPTVTRSRRQTIRLASVAEDAGIDLSCGTLTVHGEARRLTADVLYWALSPGWSGSVPDDVSLPSELRSPERRWPC